MKTTNTAPEVTMPTPSIVTTAPITTKSPATTYQPPPAFCKEKKTGNYPDPTKCDGYIACVHGTSIFMKCPVGLYYNETLGVCDWKDKVNCPQSKRFIFLSVKPFF